MMYKIATVKLRPQALSPSTHNQCPLHTNISSFTSHQSPFTACTSIAIVYAYHTIASKFALKNKRSKVFFPLTTAPSKGGISHLIKSGLYVLNRKNNS